MPIEISTLPIATEHDLQRVGQYLLLHEFGIYRVTKQSLMCNVIVLASVDDKYNKTGSTATCSKVTTYRLLTEAQAIELAREMPHVCPMWRSSWPAQPRTTMADQWKVFGDAFKAHEAKATSADRSGIAAFIATSNAPKRRRTVATSWMPLSTPLLASTGLSKTRTRLIRGT